MRFLNIAFSFVFLASVANAAVIFDIFYPNELNAENSAGAPPPKVRLQLFAEAMCPDCKEFIENQLAPVWNKLGGEQGRIEYGHFNY